MMEVKLSLLVINHNTTCAVVDLTVDFYCKFLVIKFHCGRLYI